MFLGVRWQNNVEVAVEGRGLFAPPSDVETFRARSGYTYIYAAVSGSGCYHMMWVFGCARVELGSLSINTTRILINPNEAALLGAGIRLGGEITVIPGLVIRTYTDILGEILSPIFYRTDGPLAAWHGPRISGAVGIGTVLSWGN